MSSNTNSELTPPPPPVPVTIVGKQAVCPIAFLGAAGCTLLGQTLEDICQPGQQDEAKNHWRTTWNATQTSKHTYDLTLAGQWLPAEVASHGIKAVNVQLSLGGKTADISFKLHFEAASALSPAQEQAFAQAIQKAIIPPVNQLVAIVVRDRVAHSLKQVIRQENKQSVKNKLVNTNRFTMQTHAYATVKVHA